MHLYLTCMHVCILCKNESHCKTLNICRYDDYFSPEYLCTGGCHNIFQSTQPFMFTNIDLSIHTYLILTHDVLLFSSHTYIFILFPNTLVSSVREAVVTNFYLHYLPCVCHFITYSCVHII